MKLYSVVLMVILSGYIYPVKRVVFLKPVTDLSSHQLSKLAENLSMQEFGEKAVEIYGSFPLSAYGKGKLDCPRGAQALFNTSARVIALNEITNEICLEFDHYVIDQKDKKWVHPQYWCALGDHIIDLEYLQENKGFKVFPSPVSVYDECYSSHQNDLVLTDPWHNEDQDLTYAAGTRFKRLRKNDTDTHYGLTMYDLESKKVIEGQVPRTLALIDVHYSPNKTRRKLLLAILRRWINEKGYIPFAWGGSSYLTRRNDKDEVEVVEENYLGHEVKFWRYTKEKYNTSGVDSSFICLLTQMVHIPYFCKTSLSAYTLMKPIDKYETIKNGDLIVRDGLISVISDKEKALCIHATGYIKWSGKLIEQPLNKMYKGMDTYKDLWNAYTNKKPLVVLDRDGNYCSEVELFKIVRLVKD